MTVLSHPRQFESEGKPERASVGLYDPDKSIYKRDLTLAMGRHKSSVQKINHSNLSHLLNRYTCKTSVKIGLLIHIIQILAYVTATTNAQHDVMPQQYQHNNILYFSVEENRPNGTYIGTIRSSDGQVPYIVVPSPQTPEFELKSAFNINFTSGDLTTNSMLDREHREQYHFIAIVKEPFAEIKCTVTVKDANDNAPMFLTSASNETNIVIDMPEGLRGVRKLLPLAVDFDTPQYGIKEFRIISGNTPSGTFHLVEHEAPARSTLLQNGNLGTAADDTAAAMLAAGADNPQLIQQLTQQATVLIPSQPIMQTSLSNQQSLSQGTMGGVSASGSSSSQQSKFLIDLEVSQPLDRENQSSYQLVVEAIDGGQPPQFGRLMVTVNVQDINDNDPIFLRKFYECHISEDTPKGALVHRVQAYDVDLDSNGQVSYYIKRHSSSSQQNNVNSTDLNNEVVTSRYGANSNVMSNNKQRAQQPQNLVISTGSKPVGNQRSVNMDNSGGQDSSFAPKTRSAYSSEQLFDIDPNKGEIYLANQLDFETDQLHELLVEARDHGKPYRSSYTTVKVYVIDVHDDPPVISRAIEDRRASSGESKAESSARSSVAEFVEPIPPSSFNLSNINFSNWLAQMNSSVLFVLVFVALIAVAFPVCLIKIKSRQPESDYNDTAGLTLASNNGQAKPSPNHSSSNLEHANSMMGDNMIHRHHDYQRRTNGSFGGLNGSGSFGAPNGKMSRYQYSDSSNLYHNPYPPQQRPRHHSTTSHHMPPDSPGDHQMAVHGKGGSRGGTITLLPHHHHPMLSHTPSGHHHPMDHHHHHFDGPNHGTSSLTYAHHHSRAALLQHARHHQSSHQLSSVHQAMNGLSKGGTMNSVDTHNSAHPASGSPMPATPNTTHSSGLPPNMHDGIHHSHHNSLLPSIPQSHQVCQLPPTPNHNVNQSSVFTWPPQGHDSASGCYPGPNGTLHETPGSTLDSCSTPAGHTTPQPLDRWFDSGVMPQLVNTQDWCGSYNWDYLDDWTPEYHTLMPMIEGNSSSY